MANEKSSVSRRDVLKIASIATASLALGGAVEAAPQLTPGRARAAGSMQPKRVNLRPFQTSPRGGPGEMEAAMERNEMFHELPKGAFRPIRMRGQPTNVVGGNN